MTCRAAAGSMPAMNALLVLSVILGANAAQPAAAAKPQPEKVTVVGEVVDAACYMIHPQSAVGPSHRQCTVDCAKRGVPLAILNDADKKLYFPADGNARLTDHIGERVRASGTAMEQTDPMELSMPVGEKNKLSVRVDGGYEVLTIASLEKDSPAAK